MTPEIAADYLRRRMDELGYGDRYYTRLRHFVLRSLDSITVDAEQSLLILAEPQVMVRVQSGFGVFDLSTTAANELQYEHQGSITITNYSAAPSHVRFIQGIPKAS